MTARDTFVSSVAAAEAAKASTKAAAITTHQVTIDAANSVVGYNHATGNNTALRAATAAANAAKLEAFANAEKAKQASVAVAKDVLRSTGDKGPM